MPTVLPFSELSCIYILRPLLMMLSQTHKELVSDLPDGSYFHSATGHRASLLSFVKQVDILIQIPVCQYR